MSELLSVGLDVGTTTTQLVLSRLTVENRASSFSVPDMEITRRKILYKSPVHFTPLVRDELVDGEAIKQIVEQEYKNAGITREQVDTGAVIITGETSRKENAETVLRQLSGFAGDFAVATAGPDLESVLAAKGAGAVAWSEKTGKTVLHMDIGGGTCNMALIENGNVVKTGCLNVGGRLIKHTKGKITYVSPAIRNLTDLTVGEYEKPGQLEGLAKILCCALEMAAGIRPVTELLRNLHTAGASAWIPPANQPLLSFSGGVAACMETPGDYGDLGGILGKAIRESALCKGQYRICPEAIRATVIGAGSYATQLSGSTVYYSNVRLPIQNLQVGEDITAIKNTATDYESIKKLAQRLITNAGEKPVYAVMEQDIAKALGHCISLLAPEKPCLCIDRVQLKEDSLLDVGRPVGSCLPVVIKTIIFERDQI